MLIVTAQVFVASPAAKDLFDEPAFLQHMKARRSIGVSLDDMEFDSTLVFDLALEVLSYKATVGKNHAHLTPPR